MAQTATVQAVKRRRAVVTGASTGLGAVASKLSPGVCDKVTGLP